jgi:hypothetical protein
MGCEDAVFSLATPATSGSALLLPAGQNHRRTVCREDEFPSFNALGVVRPRTTSKRAVSLDFLECVLPYEEIAQLGCKSGGKPFWKNLRFWQRTKKSAACCRSVASAVDFKLGGQPRPKLARVKREGLGPIDTDGSPPPSRRCHQQHPYYYAALEAQAVYVDGNVCPYVPLNPCPRTPSGLLYLP